MFLLFLFFFFNDTATTEIYTLSLHDALPIYCRGGIRRHLETVCGKVRTGAQAQDRKSTRLNSSHRCISYAVFCLKKKKKDIGIVRGRKNTAVGVYKDISTESWYGDKNSTPTK